MQTDRAELAGLDLLPALYTQVCYPFLRMLLKAFSHSMSLKYTLSGPFRKLPDPLL